MYGCNKLRSAGAAFSGTAFQNLFVSARYFLLSAFVGTRHAVSASFSKGKSVGNVPPERFQNQKTANGTQGGAVLFAPPSKSCRFSHPPSPCARSMAQGVSLSADSDSEGYSPSKNTSPAALSWSSLTGQLFPNLFAFPRCQTTAKKAEPFLQFDLLLFVFVFRKLIPTRS